MISKTGKNKPQPGETKIENIWEKGKKLEKFLNSIYDNNINEGAGNLYMNPFSTVKKVDEDDQLDTLDKIGLLEYSQEFDKNYNNQYHQHNDSISESIESGLINNGVVDIKDYDNFILKIEDLSFTDEKILNKIKSDVLYIECKVPLFKKDRAELFYDVFK
jgi:hypothetical protein